MSLMSVDAGGRCWGISSTAVAAISIAFAAATDAVAALAAVDAALSTVLSATFAAAVAATVSVAFAAVTDDFSTAGAPSSTTAMAMALVPALASEFRCFLRLTKIDLQASRSRIACALSVKINLKVCKSTASDADMTAT